MLSHSNDDAAFFHKIKSLSGTNTIMTGVMCHVYNDEARKRII
jgi:hypothetical protein